MTKLEPDRDSVILNEAQRSRRIPQSYHLLSPRDLIRSLAVRSACGLPVHVAASLAAPFSTSVGMTGFSALGN